MLQGKFTLTCRLTIKFQASCGFTVSQSQRKSTFTFDSGQKVKLCKFALTFLGLGTVTGIPQRCGFSDPSRDSRNTSAEGQGFDRREQISQTVQKTVNSKPSWLKLKVSKDKRLCRCEGSQGRRLCRVCQVLMHRAEEVVHFHLNPAVQYFYEHETDTLQLKKIIMC